MKGRRHFSMIELLVVIGIIALLAALLLPALKKAKDMALASQCQGNMRQCGLALAGYAADFDDWVIGGDCNAAVYPTLGTMMMGLDYAPRRGAFPDSSFQLYGFSDIPFGAVFQCPSLPPPASYKQKGRVYGASGNNCNSSQSYGLRCASSGNYYSGESVAPSPLKGLVKCSSLHQPSKLPYMVDSMEEALNASGAGLVGITQSPVWYMVDNTWAAGGLGVGGILHLRHNKRGNVWCPDGHVGSWAAIDTVEFKLPDGSGNPAYTIGYRY